MELRKVFYMNGGDGENSYAKNSFIQKDIIEATRSAIEKALLDLYDATFPDKLSVADLGCSSGPNTLSVVSDIVATVDERCRQLGRPPSEFQLFLNDLPGNDFNTVFRSLEAFYKKHEASGGGGGDGRRCFVAGVPGSFYGRLFQSSSIHFFHSSSSLHWLSQVPPELQQPDVLLNKGNINISKESPPSVCDAYAKQFKKDFSDFLRSRSKEMIVGGRMVLILGGRKTLDPTADEHANRWDLLTQVLTDMVKEGSILEEKLDLFNLPLYVPCAMEVEHIIQREGSFSLKSLELVDVVFYANQLKDNHVEGKDAVFSDQLTKGQTMANTARAALESLLACHFGDHIIEDLFFRYGKAVDVYLTGNEIKMLNFVVSLVRAS